MKLTIVTLTYNNYEELISTLQSIDSLLDDKTIESVIINGGSCRKTQQYLEKREMGIAISEPDKGISDAFNKGVEHATGDLVCFLNSGDKLLNSAYYQWALQNFSQNQCIDYCYADIIYRHPSHGDLTVKPNEDVGKVPYPHPSLIVRRNIFEQVGYFDLDYRIAMDFDFMYKLIKHKMKGCYFSKAPVVLMMGDGVSSNNGVQGINERTKILKKYGYLTSKAKYYLMKNLYKNYARLILKRVHLLDLYDFIRNKYGNAKTE